MRPGKSKLSLGPAPHDRARGLVRVPVRVHRRAQLVNPSTTLRLYRAGQGGTGTALPRGRPRGQGPLTSHAVTRPLAGRGKSPGVARCTRHRQRRSARRLQRRPLAVTDANRCRGRGCLAWLRARFICCPVGPSADPARASPSHGRGPWDTRSRRALASHEPDRLPEAKRRAAHGKEEPQTWRFAGKSELTQLVAQDF